MSIEGIVVIDDPLYAMDEGQPIASDWLEETIASRRANDVDPIIIISRL